MGGKINDDDKCIPAWEEHQGYTDTGRRGTNELTGSTYHVYRCQCGAKTLDVFPHLKNN
ncbi:hypothetical protein [Saccharothrix xinjiangensis]|uniref:Uncharacterized protein n=1 Tax=Saccharothrix xinjiangensis TaxID=204798 RepID=A0ABV9XS57_9PSEU